MEREECEDEEGEQRDWFGQLRGEEALQRGLVPHGEPIIIRDPHTVLDSTYLRTGKVELSASEVPNEAVGYVAGKPLPGYHPFICEHFDLIPIQFYKDAGDSTSAGSPRRKRLSTQPIDTIRDRWFDRLPIRILSE